MSDPAKSELPMFYSRVEALDKERHATLGLTQRQRTYEFAAKTSLVRLNVAEFNFALKTFPIVFTSITDPQPIAVLGLRRDQNLFVKPDGRWVEGAYIPVYVRRYPFIFGATGAENQYALCVDMDSDLISDTPVLPFFEDGELSEAAKQGLEMCHTFQEQHAATEAVMAKLGQSGLLTQRDAKVRLRDGSDRLLGTYVAVDEEKLSNLDDKDFLEVRHQGLLPMLYMHLASLSNWMRLLDMQVARNITEGAAATESDTHPSAPAAGT